MVKSTIKVLLLCFYVDVVVVFTVLTVQVREGWELKKQMGFAIVSLLTVLTFSLAQFFAHTLTHTQC